MPEIRYVECNEDGIDEEFIPSKKTMPKWRIPETDFQRNVVSIFYPSGYYPDQKSGGHDLRLRLILIEKAMRVIHQAERMPEMPSEWVEDRIKLLHKLRGQGKMIQFAGLLTMIENRDTRQAWKDMWVAGHNLRPVDTEYSGNAVSTKEANDVAASIANSGL